MSAPIYDDPVEHGATDPTVIRAEDGRWWMFYTQRRTSDPDDSVRWVHGTRIGTATSDDGLTWTYASTAVLPGHDTDTLWAPEVIHDGHQYRMYVTVVPGIPTAWTGPAWIQEYRSPDLQQWEPGPVIPFPSERVIDAAVAVTPDGRWRMWVKNERDGSNTWSAVSDDLDHWDIEGVAVPATPAHEGPNVFRLGGWYWMITDEWRGLGVHRSADTITWHRQDGLGGLLLADPGTGPMDQHIAHHADVVVTGGETAVVYYFTHPYGEPYSHPWGSPADGVRRRQSRVHAARLTVEGDALVADRNASVRPRGAVPGPSRDPAALLESSGTRSCPAWQPRHRTGPRPRS